MLLITGATGFLGGAVAAQAIRVGDAARLRLLVRAETHEDGLDRIKAILATHGIPEADIARLNPDQIVLGDLENGIAHREAVRFADVRCCIHSAALATFSKNPRIEPINVEGSVKLAKCLMEYANNLQRFIYVGTAMACGTQIDAAHVPERDVLDQDAEHVVPYTASKASAERALRAVLPEDVLIVARPSIIVGDTIHGCASSQSIFWVFLMAQKLGCFTAEGSDQIDIIPVDYAAAALLFLAGKTDLGFSTYHISAGRDRSNNFREIDIALADARGVPAVGANYRLVGSEDLAALFPIAQVLFPDVSNRLILHAFKLYGAFAALNYTFDNARLASEGFAPPPFLTAYLSRCVETAGHIPLSEQMKWDFK
jgi:nucleoside-diphosphate-sugar epimerase